MEISAEKTKLMTNSANGIQREIKVKGQKMGIVTLEQLFQIMAPNQRFSQGLRVLGSIPGLATYFRFSFRFFKKGSCQLLAKVCVRSTG